MSARDPAAARFFAIQAARLAGAALVLVGVLVQAGQIEALADLPRWFGFVLIAAGLADVFLVPVLLARRWRTPPP